MEKQIYVDVKEFEEDKRRLWELGQYLLSNNPLEVPDEKIQESAQIFEYLSEKYRMPPELKSIEIKDGIDAAYAVKRMLEWMEKIYPDVIEKELHNEEIDKRWQEKANVGSTLEKYGIPRL